MMKRILVVEDQEDLRGIRATSSPDRVTTLPRPRTVGMAWQKPSQSGRT
jgi:hypothetical protein